MEKKPPAVIIIVRHAARLDAADRQWHLNTPVPYDPPLTYGGWTQSRSLGARIASLLQAREQPDTILEDKIDGGDGGCSNQENHGLLDGWHKHGSPKRHKIIIHTSPYLRCLQTSIAISAGIGQYFGTHQRPAQRSIAAASKSHVEPLSVLSDAPLATAGSDEAGLNENSLQSAGKAAKVQVVKAVHKALLRIDAFLGEWQNPEYFQSITPPPESRMMVVNAKAEMMKQSDYVEPVQTPVLTGTGNFPGGWGSASSVHSETSTSSDEDGPLMDMSQVQDSLPPRARSYSSNARFDSKTNGKEKDNSSIVIFEHRPYKPPKPTYAISSNEGIPTGYVAHARDACVETDFQWDSQRAPQSWGSGGEFGEEWPSMHNRFRNGLQKMIQWYSENDPVEECNHTNHTNHTKHEGYTDTVLILITHGAGCNALVGALTDQPVLIDVPMASLTMAVRRDITEDKNHDYSKDVSISDAYDVSVIASTEHLRAGSNPFAIQRLQVPKFNTHSSIHSHPAYNFRQKYGHASSLSATINHSFALDDDVTKSGSLYRSSSVATSRAGGARGFNANVKPLFNGGGLWTPPGMRNSRREASEETNLLPNSSDRGEFFAKVYGEKIQASRTSEYAIDDTSRRGSGDTIGSLYSVASSKEQPSNGRVTRTVESGNLDGSTESRRPSQPGLWGDFRVERDFSGFPKRRWTLDQRNP